MMSQWISLLQLWIVSVICLESQNALTLHIQRKSEMTLKLGSLCITHWKTLILIRNIAKIILIQPQISKDLLNP